MSIYIHLQMLIKYLNYIITFPNCLLLVFKVFSIFSKAASGLSVLSLESNLDKVNSSYSTQELTVAKSLAFKLLILSFNKYLTIALVSKRTRFCSGKSKMTFSAKWSTNFFLNFF